MLSWDAEHGHVVEEQLSLILGENYVLTFQERDGDVFQGVPERIRTAAGRIRQRGPDYLAYALVDAVVDHYFQVLEAIGERTERLEEDVLLDPQQSTMHELHALKRELISVRRAIWPLREMLGTLHRSETRLFAAQTRALVQHLHPADLPGGHLRHELRAHARAGTALGLSRASGGDGRGGGSHGVLLPEEGVVVGGFFAPDGRSPKERFRAAEAHFSASPMLEGFLPSIHIQPNSNTPGPALMERRDR